MSSDTSLFLLTKHLCYIHLKITLGWVCLLADASCIFVWYPLSLSHTHMNSRKYHLAPNKRRGNESWGLNHWFTSLPVFVMAGFKKGTRDCKDQPESRRRGDIMTSENDMQLKMDKGLWRRTGPSKDDYLPVGCDLKPASPSHGQILAKRDSPCEILPRFFPSSQYKKVF